jgi:hypothetical protein
VELKERIINYLQIIGLVRCGIVKEIYMPKVGNKTFKYTKKGKEEAKKYAKKTGKKMKKKKGY